MKASAKKSVMSASSNPSWDLVLFVVHKCYWQDSMGKHVPANQTPGGGGNLMMDPHWRFNSAKHKTPW